MGAVQRTRPLIIAAIVLGTILLGRLVRQETGLLSVDAVQGWVTELGWRAPVVYLGLVTFRLFLFLPAIVVLPAGGLVFGPALGATLGAVGIVLSALLGFGVSRGIARRWVRAHLERRHAGLRVRIERAGPLLVGLVTAHPVGPMSAFHWGAGLVAIPVVGFFLAVACGAAVRAGTLAFFGSTLSEPGSWQFFVAAAVVTAAAALPFAHRGFRRWAWGGPAATSARATVACAPGVAAGSDSCAPDRHDDGSRGLPGGSSAPSAP